MTHTYKFYKDESGWFIDLPEVIEMGLFTKGNLQMVAGADDLLQRLSKDGENVTLEFSEEPFDGYEHHMMMSGYGMDSDELSEYGHPIEIGAYYNRESDGFVIWLCPVTKYVFDGKYPQDIYFKVINN
jgi:hypothetical protein